MQSTSLVDIVDVFVLEHEEGDVGVVGHAPATQLTNVAPGT